MAAAATEKEKKELILNSIRGVPGTAGETR
jgi:hypothetical protein